MTPTGRVHLPRGAEGACFWVIKLDRCQMRRGIRNAVVTLSPQAVKTFRCPVTSLCATTAPLSLFPVAVNVPWDWASGRRTLARDSQQESNSSFESFIISSVVRLHLLTPIDFLQKQPPIEATAPVGGC
jgi:hypothetical protein